MEKDALKESIEILGDESVCSINGKVIGLACRSIKDEKIKQKELRLRKRREQYAIRKAKKKANFG